MYIVHAFISRHLTKIEHMFAVSYAACETFQLHHYIYFVSVALFICGLIVQLIGRCE
jgi:hypothetical protein